MDPVGDAQAGIAGTGTEDAVATISFGAGAAHNPWGAPNPAPRLTQPLDDTDFTITAKFDSAVSGKYQNQGITIEQDQDDWLRFDVYSDGSNTRTFTAQTTNGTSSAVASQLVGDGAPMWVRVIRQGDQFIQQHSTNGQSYQTVASFTRPMDVATVGLMAGNFPPTSGAPAPAHTARIDYVEVATDPISGEDAGAPSGGTGTLQVDVTGAGSVDADPAGASHECGTEVTLTAQPDAGQVFEGWSGALTGTDTPATLTIAGPQTTVGATFSDAAPAPAPPVISGVQADPGHDAATITFSTDIAASGEVEFGTDTNYGLGTETSPAGTSHTVQLTDLAPETTYHYRVSASAAGETATGVDRTFTTDAAPAPAPPVISGVQADPGHDAATITFSTDIAASGEVEFGTDTNYGLGTETSPAGTSHTVQLTDLAPETTYHYRVSASAAGETATGVDRTFTTDAAPAPAPPVISGVQADPGHDAATITFSTDIAASGEVEFGTDTNYGLGTETSPAGTSHTVQLTDLAPETTYHYRVSASAAGETATGVDRTFTTDAAPVAGPASSDDFNTCQIDDGRWTFVDPVGDAQAGIAGTGTENAVATISFGAGAAHNPWGAPNPAPRLTQPLDDTDFTITAKFDSAVSGKYQNQGITIEQDQDDWLRFDVYSDGSNTRTFTAQTTNGTSSAVASQVVGDGAPMWVRVIRQGDQFIQQHSTNGQSFQTVASFTRPMDVATVGLMAGNFPPTSGAPAPAHTARIDYVEVATDPIARRGRRCAERRHGHPAGRRHGCRQRGRRPGGRITRVRHRGDADRPARRGPGLRGLVGCAHRHRHPRHPDHRRPPDHRGRDVLRRGTRTGAAGDLRRAGRPRPRRGHDHLLDRHRGQR